MFPDTSSVISNIDKVKRPFRLYLSFKLLKNSEVVNSRDNCFVYKTVREQVLLALFNLVTSDHGVLVLR